MGKRTVIVVVLAALLAGGALGSVAMYRHAKSIRNLPLAGPFLDAVKAPGPIGMAYRVMLMKPGSDEYHRPVLHYLFNDAELADSFLNRRLLETLVLATDPQIVAVNIDSYPLTATPRLASALETQLERVSNLDEMSWSERFQAVAASRRALVLLGHFPAGREIANAWIDEHILGPRDVELFRNYVTAIASVEGVDVAALLAAFDRELTAPPSDEQTGVAWAMLEEDAYHLGALFDWATEKLAASTIAPKRVGALLRTSICSESTSTRARDWFEELETGKRIAAFDGMFQPEYHWVRVPSDVGVEQHEMNFAYEGLDCLQGPFLDLAWATLESDPARQLALLHALWHSDHPDALPRMKSALASGDTALRKGTVVLLARHEEIGVSYDIDDAFRGAAPRLVLFPETYQYVSSAATQRYEALSGHDHGYIGKRFPPAFGSKVYATDDTAAWRAFIDEFRSFPSTDDAYYRLAYAHMLNGDLAEARSVVREYQSRTFLDADANSYMMQFDALLQTLEGGSALAVAQAPLERILKAEWLNRPNAEKQAIENAVLVVDLLHAYDSAAAEIFTTDSELAAARRALDLVRLECRGWDPNCSVPAEYLVVKRKLGRVLSFDPIIYLTNRISR